MNEDIIRYAIRQRLISRASHGHNSIIIDELGLHNGQARADVVLLGRFLAAYEIKSARDDLSRLSYQVPYYNSVFNRITLVVANRLYPRALDHVPVWWGIITVNEGPRGGIHFRRMRSPIYNSRTNPDAIARLLWKSEACEILAACGVSVQNRRINKTELRALLVQSLSISQLRKQVVEKIRQRAAWRDRL